MRPPCVEFPQLLDSEPSQSEVPTPVIEPDVQMHRPGQITAGGGAFRGAFATATLALSGCVVVSSPPTPAHPVTERVLPISVKSPIASSLIDISPWCSNVQMLELLSVNCFEPHFSAGNWHYGRPGCPSVRPNADLLESAPHSRGSAETLSTQRHHSSELLTNDLQMIGFLQMGW